MSDESREQILEVSFDGVHVYNKSEAGAQLKDKVGCLWTDTMVTS